MTKHRHTNAPDGQPIPEELGMIKRDEDFINALSRGMDPSGGEDQLAALLLELKRDVDRDMPAAPTLAELGIEPSDEELPEGVVSLHERRRKPVGAFAHGLVGAAAATLVIGGFGTAIHASEPGDALYGLNQQLFGGYAEDRQIVELASTLDEANQKSEAGDIEGARLLLEQARLIVSQMNQRDRSDAEEEKADAVPSTVSTEVSTTTVAPSEAPEPAPPVTVTVTVTEQIPAPVESTPVESEVIPTESEPLGAPVESMQPVPTPLPTLPVEIPNF